MSTPTKITPLAWSDVDTILLDMDGTFLDLHYDSHFWLTHLHNIYASKHNIEIDQARERLAPIFKDNAGTLNWYDVHFWTRTVEIDIIQEKRRTSDKIAYLPGAENFLQACKSNCQDVRLITNGHRSVLDIKIEKTGLDRYFDQMLCSHELGAAKEQSDFWPRLEQHHGFDKSRTVFIDDSEAVLDAAADYGIQYLYSIQRPDSQKARTAPSAYPLLENLNSIFI